MSTVKHRDGRCNREGGVRGVPKIVNPYVGKCVPVWFSGRALRQQRKRLWVRFPGNTHTNENV